MTHPPKIPKELLAFCEKCARGLARLSHNEQYIRFISAEMPALLQDRKLFATILRMLVEGEDYPDLQRQTLFDNELLLYADPDRHFSMRLYLWGPGEYSCVHDHNSWGVIGPVCGTYGVLNYRREDDAAVRGSARLTEVERLLLEPGETASTLPFAEGIHKTGNPTAETMISISIYGKPIPRGYLNGYDVENQRVYRILPPGLKKKTLASQALHCIE